MPEIPGPGLDQVNDNIAEDAESVTVAERLEHMAGEIARADAAVLPTHLSQLASVLACDCMLSGVLRTPRVSTISA